MEAPPGVGANLLSPWSDGFFATLADNIPNIVFTTAPDGTIEYYNARWFEYTGLTPEQTYTNFGYRQAVHPDDVQRLIDCGRNARASGSTSTSEARYRRADGVYRWHRVTAVPHRDADGNVIRWLGTAIDIEESHAADEALRALSTEANLQVWTVLPDGGALEYLGKSRKALQLIHPSDMKDLEREWARASATGNPFHHVFRMATGVDGTYRWNRATAVPVHDDGGAIARWYGITLDIHDELLARDATDQDIEAKIIRDVARVTPSLLFIVDSQGDITFVNERWMQLTGVPAENLLGKGIARLMHPDDRAAVDHAWDHRLLGGDEVVMQYRLRTADGRYRWIETRTMPERDEHGVITRWMGVGLEIDEHRRTLAALEYLIEAGMTLASESDEHEMLRRLSEAALSGLADVCAIDLLDPAPNGMRIVTAPPGTADEVAQSIASYGPPVRDEDHPIAQALYFGRTIFLREVDAAFWNAKIRPERRTGWQLANPHSYISVPIRANDVTFGALTVLRNVTRTPFEQSDLRIVEEVARRAALAIVNKRLGERLQRESIDRFDQYRRIAEYSPQVMWTADAAGSIDWFSRRWYEYTGQTADPNAFRAFSDHVRRSGEPFEGEHLVRGADGRARWHLVRAVPEKDERGNVLRWYGMTVDIHESRRAARTLRVFADLGEALSETIDLQKTLDAAMEVIVPEYADWSYIALADEERELRISAVYAAEDAREARLRALLGQKFLRPDANGGSARSYSHRIPHLIRDNVRDHAAKNILAPALRIFDEIGFSSVLTLPLIVSGVARGTLVLGMSDGSRDFDADDVPFFQELARRIAPAIANAELYERELRVARSFQAAALPTSLPDVPGYEFDAVYEAGRAEALVGGDWYDAFVLVDGRIVLSIGDVAGSGLRAAVMMSNVRQAIRGVAHVHADPSLMLEAADGIVRSQHGDTYVTAFVGVLDPVRNVLTYQSAGHLRPLLARPEGGVVELDGGGLPLGLRTGAEPPNCAFELPKESVLVLYTDGLVESTHDFNEGHRRVVEALARPEIADADSPATALHDAVLVDGSKDDVAILTVRIGTPPAGIMHRIASATDVRRVREVRRAMLDELRRGGLGKDALAIAEMILVELTGNLVRYAPGESSLSLIWNEKVPVLHLLDSGPGYTFAAKLPTDPMSESGRGLFLIAALAKDLVVTHRGGGGSHTIVVFNT